jgi:transposase
MLATQEAEIRRIEAQSQLRQIVQETLSQKNPSQKKKRSQHSTLTEGSITPKQPKFVFVV